MTCVWLLAVVVERLSCVRDGPSTFILRFCCLFCVSSALAHNQPFFSAGSLAMRALVTDVTKKLEGDHHTDSL